MSDVQSIEKIPFTDKTLRQIGALPFGERPIGIEGDGNIKTAPIASGMTDYFVRDSLTQGFSLRITAKAKVFYAERKLAGRPCRFACGDYPGTSLKKARDAALAALREMAAGIDPNHVVKDAKKTTEERWDRDKLTFGFVVKRDAERKAVDDAKSTARDRIDVATWAGREPLWVKPVHEVTVTDVKAMMDSITRKISGTTALKVWRYTRAAWGRMSSAEEPRVNPFDEYLKSFKLPETKRRNNFLATDEEQGRNWLQAIAVMRDGTTGRRPFAKQVMADYILLSLCWGSRRSEVAGLTWDDVDFVRKTVIFRNTKNKKDHLFPLTPGCEKILLQRKHDNTLPRGRDVKRAARGEAIPVPPFVFPSEKRGFHLTEPAGALDIAEAGSGLHVTMHDLRRTFAGDVAVAIMGGDTSGGRGDFRLVKMAMNHSDQNADVTQSYISNRKNLTVLWGIFEEQEQKILTAAGIMKPVVKRKAKAKAEEADPELDVFERMRAAAAKDPEAMARFKEAMSILDSTNAEQPS